MEQEKKRMCFIEWGCFVIRTYREKDYGKYKFDKNHRKDETGKPDA